MGLYSGSITSLIRSNLRPCLDYIVRGRMHVCKSQGGVERWCLYSRGITATFFLFGCFLLLPPIVFFAFQHYFRGIGTCL